MWHRVGTRCYPHRLPAKKLSVALDEKVAREAARSAQRQRVSLLRGCAIEASTKRARLAGRACALSVASDIVDATVVVGTLARNDLVVTSVPSELERIAAALGRRLTVHAI